MREIPSTYLAGMYSGTLFRCKCLFVCAACVSVSLFVSVSDSVFVCIFSVFPIAVLLSEANFFLK